VRAVVYDRFEGPLEVREVPEPQLTPRGALIRVEATGLCRSDWHGWLGHDPDIATFPHVPGHELAGTVHAVGSQVTGWTAGRRVTVPFVCACGRCAECAAGEQQVCRRQTQPGFTHWGSFAELVAVDAADVNLVALPDDMDSVTAAALGCRVATAYRAVVAQGRARPGQWVAVFGCGGVGLSAVMVAAAGGARVVAVDVSDAALQLAVSLGAEQVVNSSEAVDAAEVVRQATDGGAHLTLDALGSPDTCAAAIRSLRRRGRHVQVGLLPTAVGDPAVPMAAVVAGELEVVGSHGMPAHGYPELLGLVTAGRLRPDLLVTRRITLDEVPAALPAMGRPGFPAGVTVIVPDAVERAATEG
jgi:alcohol dehydrogenase